MLGDTRSVTITRSGVRRVGLTLSRSGARRLLFAETNHDALQTGRPVRLSLAVPKSVCARCFHCGEHQEYAVFFSGYLVVRKKITNSQNSEGAENA